MVLVARPVHLQLTAMADSDSECGDAFKVDDAIVIRSKTNSLQATVLPKFSKTLDGIRYICLDFYQSRGIHKVLCCRLPPLFQKNNRADCTRFMSELCSDIRKNRDHTFKKLLRKHHRKPDNDAGDHRFLPRTKIGKSAALESNDVISITLPEFSLEPYSDEVVPDTSCRVEMVIERKNRYSELWLQLDGEVLQWLTKSILRKWIDNNDDRSDSVPSDSMHATPDAPNQSDPSAASMQMVREAPVQQKQLKLNAFFKQ